jgi:hypothetical protein
MPHFVGIESQQHPWRNVDRFFQDDRTAALLRQVEEEVATQMPRPWRRGVAMAVDRSTGSDDTEEKAKSGLDHRIIAEIHQCFNPTPDAVPYRVDRG